MERWCALRGGHYGAVLTAMRPCTGYQFKADNVIISYSATTGVAESAQQLASGTAAFVSVDGEVDQSAFPEATIQVPVAGGALIVVYNLPGNPTLVLAPHWSAVLFIANIRIISPYLISNKIGPPGLSPDVGWTYVDASVARRNPTVE
jgi:hypothetical protein